MRVLIAILVTFVVTMNAYALDKIFTAHIAPYTIDTKKTGDPGAKGAIYEVVEELSKRVQGNSPFKFVPWKRAQKNVSEGKNFGIIPLTWTKERLPKYRWIAEILRDEMLFITIKPNVKIDKLADIKKLRVGVLKGSFGETDLKNNGITKYSPVNQEEANLGKMKLDRIDVMYAAKLVTQFTCKSMGAKCDSSKLRFGLKLRDMRVHLGASKNTSPAEIIKWQEALYGMHADGSYERIMSKYR